MSRDVVCFRVWDDITVPTLPSDRRLSLAFALLASYETKPRTKHRYEIELISSRSITKRANGGVYICVSLSHSK